MRNDRSERAMTGNVRDWTDPGAGPERSTVGQKLLDFLYPPRCLKCDAATATGAGLCGMCWLDVSFVEAPYCGSCGRPFELDPGIDTLCALCIAEEPTFDRMRSALIYDDASRSLVTGFKYADRTDRAPVFGKWLARAGTELIETCDLIVPVPLHRSRLLSRRFNQSALLAQALGAEALVPVGVDVLQRTRRTKQQVGLTPAKRHRNVRGAFDVRPKAVNLVKDKVIILVDDVVTSGATVEASIRALRKAGARAVDVLCLARTLPRA